VFIDLWKLLRLKKMHYWPMTHLLSLLQHNNRKIMSLALCLLFIPMVPHLKSRTLLSRCSHRIAASWEGERVGGRPPDRLLALLGLQIYFLMIGFKRKRTISYAVCSFVFFFANSPHSIPRWEEQILKRSSRAFQKKSPCHKIVNLLIENLYSMKMDRVTDVIDLYKQLNVPYEPLSLIDPHCECPQPEDGCTQASND
jgi:hypothetical protein